MGERFISNMGASMFVVMPLFALVNAGVSLGSLAWVPGVTPALVAGIVKLDDLGLHLSKRRGPARRLGAAILAGAPYLMKGLSFAGTLAMFLVGGGILVHGLPRAEALGDQLARASAALPGASVLIPSLFAGLVGLLAGAVILALVLAFRRLLPRKP